MSRRAIALAVAGLCSSTSATRADAPGATTPAVDIADLPPLPAATEEVSSAATMLAASSAEEDVVVGAAKREQSLGNVASAVTVISGDRLRRFGYRTVSEAIASVAGVFIQDTRLTHQVGIRGLQIPGGFNSRILVLVDGATINEAWGAFAGVGFDAIVSIDDIARIEVIRGPVSSLYGTNAFFGILNIVTRGAAEGARAWGRVGGHSIQGGIASAGFAVGSVHEQLRGSVMVHRRLGESYTVDEIAGNTSLDADGGDTLIAALVGSYGGSFGQLRAYRARRESAFAPYDSDPTLDPGYQLFNTQLLAEGGHTRELSDHVTLSARAYGSLYRYEDQIREEPGALFFDFGDATTIGAELRARLEVLDDGKLGVTTGAEASYSRTESRAFDDGLEAEGVDVPVNFTTQGVYAEADSQVTRWLGVTAGARFDRHSVLNNAARVSPRGALFLAKPERYGLKLLYAEGFRYASMFEGFFDDGRDFAANNEIEPETIRSFEAVAWAKLGGLSVRASAYQWDARDVIEQRPFTNEDGDDLLRFENIGRYSTQGVEVEGSYRTLEGWYGFAGLAANRVGTEVADAMGVPVLEYGVVPNAPALTAAGGVSTPRLLERAHVSAELQYVGRRETRALADGTPGPDAPAWVGLHAAIYLPSVRGFDVTVGGRNLIGKRDLVPAPDDYDRFPDTGTIVVPRIPGEGREVYVKVGYSY